MAIIYSYPQAIPKASDFIIGTVTYDASATNPTRENPTRQFKIADLAATLPGNQYTLTSASQGSSSLIQLTDGAGALSGTVNVTAGAGITLQASTANNIVITNDGVASFTAAATTFINPGLAVVSGVTSIAPYLSATGTPGGANYLRGDNTWSTPVTTLDTTDGTFVNLTPNTASTGAVTVTADLSATGAPGNSNYLRGDNQWFTPVNSLTTTDGTFINLTPNTAATGTVTVTADLSATGSASNQTFLRGDNQWAIPGGGGTVIGTGTTGKVTKWKSTSEIEDSIITEIGTTISVGGNFSTQGAEINKYLTDGAGNKGTDGQLLSSTTVGADREIAWVDAPATGVVEIIAGTGIGISPDPGTGTVTITNTLPVGGSPVSGGGTANYGTKWVNNSSVTTSPILFDNAAGAGAYMDLGRLSNPDNGGQMEVRAFSLSLYAQLLDENQSPGSTDYLLKATSSGVQWFDPSAIYIKYTETSTVNMDFVDTDVTLGGGSSSNTKAASQLAIKSYVDSTAAGSGSLIYQGGYDASTNTPDLTTSPNSIKQGWTYAVTVAGDASGFWSPTLGIGDLIIANQDNPTAATEWTEVQSNIDVATATVLGIANFPTAGGLSVTAGAVSMPNTGVTAAVYTAPTITIDAKGRITAATDNPLVGTVTSVALAAPSAFTVSGSPITDAGTLTLAGAGSNTQFIDGTGSLQSTSALNPTLGLVTDGTNVDMRLEASGLLLSTVQFTAGSAMEITQSSGNNMLIDLDDSGVTAGTYFMPQIVVDAKGRITSATPTSGITGGGTLGKIPKFSATNSVTDSIMTETTGLITTAGSIKPTSITDTNNGIGTAGQVLSSTGSALDWIDNTGEGYDFNSSTAGNNVDLNLTSTSGTDDSTVLFTAGSNMTITQSGGANVTFASEEINEIAVTVQNVGGNNKYFIDGAQQQSLELVAGFTYRLDQSDSSNSTHPLLFSTNPNNSPSAPYTTGVTVVGTPGSAGAYTQIILEQDTPKLYYYCQNHANMGGEVIDPRAADTFTSFTATDGTFVNLTPNTTQTGVVTLAGDLSATGTPGTGNFLRGDNTWASVPAAYTLNLTGNSGGPVTVPTGSTIDIEAAGGLDTAIVSSGTNRIATISPDYTTAANIVLASADGTSDTLVDADDILFSNGNTVKHANLSQIKSYVGGVNASLAKNDYTSNGTQTDFVLSNAPFSRLFTNVFINGVYQEKETYTVTGTTLAFLTAPPTGLSIEVITTVASSVVPGANSLTNYQTTGDGTTIAFNLPASPANINFTNVYINGVYQNKTTYNVAGSTLSFTAGAPATGDLIEVMIITSASLVQFDPQNYTTSTISASTTAVKNTLYVFTADLTLTLPATPSDGDSIKISNLSAVATCILARNGSLIMGNATDLTLNNAVASFELIYSGATKGWVIIGPQ